VLARKMKTLMLAGMVAAGMGTAALAQGQVIVVTGGGLFERGLKENIAAAFTKETGIQVRFVASNPGERATKTKAMSEANKVEWDIVLSSETHARQLASYIADGTCLKAGVEKFIVAGGCRDFGVLGVIGGLPLVNRTDKFGGKNMQNWADFFNVKDFPGPRALPNYGSPLVVLMPALLADGVPKDKLFPIDFDRAFKVLDRIKPQVTAWWKSGDQSQQLFRSQEASAGQLWSGRALDLVNEGMPLNVIWDGAPTDEAYWVVLKGAPNADNALKFLNFFYSRSEGHAGFYATSKWDTANKAYLESINAAERGRHPGLFLDRMIREDSDWSVANAAEINRRWNEWISR
jgi:mannopine transport system substrate-binding protein